MTSNGRGIRVLGVALCLSGALASLDSSAAAQEYAVGVDDVVLVTVWGRPELSGKFTVDAEGTIKVPLIDRVSVAGHTVRVIEDELKQRLSAGYLNRPQVTVEVEQYRSQRVFVQGEVRQPGSVTLSGDTKLLDVLAKAGSVTPDAGDEVLIVRQPPKRTAADAASGVGTPGETEVIRVDLMELQRGVQTRNVTLRDGDTVVVQRGEKVYVTGYVRTPGAYTVTKSTSVLQALALAGGITEQGASGRIRVLRRTNGKEQKIDAKLDDIVQPGDTIVVPARFF
jgi:polysaccharide biosynthesis/export protein